MELINVTKLQAGYTTALDVQGREQLVVVIKGSFRIPRGAGEGMQLHEKPLPLIAADEFSGEPGLSACLFESDYAPKKAACDVLLVGSAYAPQQRPTTAVPVTLHVGAIAKSFRVTGDRSWAASAVSLRVTAPRPFEVKPISYDFAFGGIDDSVAEAALAFAPNPVGRGFAKRAAASWLDGRPLPNCEESSRAISEPAGDYVPMAFGPVGRAWQPRIRFAGTYDEAWLEHDFPFLPKDFDERYFQSAPLDQQLEIPSGPLEVMLLNLTPDGQRSFELPFFEARVHIFPKGGQREDHLARLDTIVFEPDAERVSLSWRVCRPLKRDLFEIAQVQVGGRGREWWLARASGEADKSAVGMVSA